MIVNRIVTTYELALSYDEYGYIIRALEGFLETRLPNSRNPETLRILNSLIENK